MFLITMSAQILSRGFLSQRKRLLLGYLMTIIAILGASETSLYFFLIRSFNQQLDQELLTLVQAAAPSLDTIKSEGRQSLDRDVLWRNLFSQKDHSLEWYNANGKLLAREGKVFPRSPLIEAIVAKDLPTSHPIFQHQDQIRSVTISVYANDPDDSNLLLEGYIRASESTQKIEITLSKLRLGLVLGGFTALLLIAISSVYLTQQALVPVKHGFQRIKQFTVDVSHQLRTPLTRISLATEILLSHTDKIQPSDARKLTIINAAVEQLKRLVEELLFLVRADVTLNSTELQFDRVSLAQLLQSVSEQFEPIAQAKGINFEVRLSNNVSLMGDAAKLTRLFTHLLNNAFDYTDPGGSVVFTMKQFQGNALVSVKDTGMGVADEYLPYIFQCFWRSDEAKIKHPEGFGLGLTTAQAISQQHRGEITVSSQRGTGSCFQVYLPLT